LKFESVLFISNKLLLINRTLFFDELLEDSDRSLFDGLAGYASK